MYKKNLLAIIIIFFVIFYANPGHLVYGKDFYTQIKQPKGEVSILISTLERRLYVLLDGKIYKSYMVAVGSFETPTPIGLFKITEKAKWGEGFGSRWMRLNVPWGIYGIHGTNRPSSIGGFASHGCIRMHNKNVEELYSMVKVGTKVYIVGGIDGPFTFGFRTLVEGSRGSDVREVQKRLHNLGYYSGSFDGIYGQGTRASVIAFQIKNGLRPTGIVDAKTYEKLGIMRFE
ncbi:L,D-transpeptidase family protein [Thermovenabulum sp.]|uniref:L,D-transpeptidase family protein n=1 Tax=Thermovenabulum sp. TaxID=3100335 RepID=UPI003C7D38D9